MVYFSLSYTDPTMMQKDSDSAVLADPAGDRKPTRSPVHPMAVSFQAVWTTHSTWAAAQRPSTSRTFKHGYTTAPGFRVGPPASTFPAQVHAAQNNAMLNTASQSAGSPPRWDARRALAGV
jgi:hypothetical protein